MEKLSKNARVLMVLLLVLMGWALFVYIYQFIYGLGVTGANNAVPWGIYIVNFAFLIGVSAGGIAVASLSHLAGLKKYKPIGKIAEIVAIISLILAVMSIIVNAGKPFRLFNLFIYINPTSPITWDLLIITIYFVLCLLLLWFGLKNKEKLVKVLAYISLPAFVLVHSITAWIFGLMKSQPGWHTTILAPLFICSALVSGLALVILAIEFVIWAFNIDIPDDVPVDLGGYLKILLPILFYLLFCEFLTIGFAQVPSAAVMLEELMKGRFSPIFWFDMVLGIIVPFVLLVLGFGKTRKGMSLICALCFFGVFAERTDIVLPSLYHPLLKMSSPASYFPTWVEWSLIAGIYAFGVFLFMIACLVIPLKEKVKEG